MEIINSPYEKLLQMYIIERNEDTCKIGLRYRKDLTNPHGYFHGGVIAAIIDVAAVHALRTIFPQGPFFTVNLDVRYKQLAASGEIIAEARSRYLKGKFFETEVKVVNSQNELIAQARVKSFLPNYTNEPAFR